MFKEEKMRIIDIEALGLALMSFEKAAEGQRGHCQNGEDAGSDGEARDEGAAVLGRLDKHAEPAS